MELANGFTVPFAELVHARFIPELMVQNQFRVWFGSYIPNFKKPPSKMIFFSGDKQ